MHSDGRYAMGTVLEISLVAEPAVARRSLARLFGEVERLEALLSRYRPESDVSLLNRTAGTGARRVSPELGELLVRSLELSRETRGSFDVSVGPLVALWHQAARRGEPPSQPVLARARARVGPGALAIDASGAVALAPGSAVDLGGIAKGYALDRLAELLARRNVGAALLSFGQSSTWAIGAPPDAPGWRLLARAPGGGYAGLLTLRDRALSVSGSLGRWIEIGGRRYGHVLDPRSGLPLQRRRQALVVAPDATRAEALSTALLVLGEREGLEIVAERAGCEGLLLDADGRSWRTPGFDAAVAFEPWPPPPQAAR